MFMNSVRFLQGLWKRFLPVFYPKENEYNSCDNGAKSAMNIDRIIKERKKERKRKRIA